MKTIEEMTMKLAEACRKTGLNFVIAIEDGEIHGQSSIRGESPLRKLGKTFKEIIKG